MRFTMTTKFARSFIFVILLIGVSSASVEGKMVVKPGSIVKFKVPILPEIENFSNQEAKLEDITDRAHQAGITEKLLQNPEVQTTIERCKNFYVPLVCSDTPYRSMDGSCNNLNHPYWGKAVTEQRRLLPPNYEGTNGIRKSVNGKDLPLSRRISLSVRNISNSSTLVSALFTFFGQFITHDMTLTPAMTENGVPPSCCDPSKKGDPFCVVETIPPDDPFYGQYNVTCRAIARAAPFPKCTFGGKRGVVNKKSSFIDASHVYDNTDEHSKELRTNDGTGKLRSQDTKFGKLLPKNHRKETLYCPVPNIEKCFEGGDDRTNQHSMLITLQTMYLRLHNKIADSLHQLNPNWNDDKLYQESRRIVIALHQYIIYEDYLPFLIGSDNMVRYDLYPNFQDGSLYNDEVDPSMLVEFSGAAFRAHSTVSQYVSGFMPLLKFRNTYSNVQLIHNGWMNPLLTGACELPSEKNDEFQAEDISDYLYKGPGETYGGDMTATDIQRGRDIGLPSYTQMLHFCFNGLQINDYSQLWNSGLMTGRSVRELMDLYDDVRDVDLLMGILREIRDDRSVFSPTAICITAIQFYRLKFGDSFFFTHTNGRNPFKREQLETLRTYSMARLICETTRVEKVRKNPFMIPSGNNPLVLCRSFSRMDFMAWKD